MRFVITRFSFGLATLGLLRKENGEFVAYTLEPMWADNRPKVSCIPLGSYKAVRHVSPKFGETFLFLDVPGRSEIVIHRGNYPKNTEGCVLLGLWQRSDGAVLESRAAISKFLSACRDENEIEIVIRELEPSGR